MALAPSFARRVAQRFCDFARFGPPYRRVCRVARRGGGSTSSGNTVTYIGLPVVGFAVQTFSNGTLSVGGVNVLSNYGGNFVHKGTRFVF